MHRESRGAREAIREGDLIVWTAEHPEGFGYAAVFNLGESPLTLELPMERIGLSGVTAGFELWSGATAELTVSGELPTTVPSHGVRLFRLD